MTDADVALVRTAQSEDERTSEQLVEAYREGVRLLERAIRGLDAEQIRARPISGKMSSLEVLCHVADCDQFLADRLKRTIATDRPLLIGVDATPYLARLHYHDRDPQLQLSLLGVTREQMAADLARIEPSDWSREAVHSESGVVTVRQELLHAIRHLERHVAAIHEKREALGL